METNVSNEQDVKFNVWNGFASNLPKYEHVIKNLILEKHIHHVIEIGSFLGNSTIIFSKILSETKQNGNVYAVDCWDCDAVQNTCVQKYKEKKKLENLLPLYEQFLMNCMSKNVKNVIPLRMKSCQAAEKLKINNSSKYMLYIDGDHSFEGVSMDLNLWWKKFTCKGMKTNLLICGDDWNHVCHKDRKKGINYKVDHKKEKIKQIDLLKNNNSFLSKSVIEFSKNNNFSLFVFGKLWWLEMGM